jgi:hypothetical protein
MSAFEPPIHHFTHADIQAVINHLNPKKSPGYDLLLELPTVGIKYLTQIFNSVLLLNYFPSQWKVAQIILILKPGKSPHVLPFYRPISLLHIVSKVLEKLLLTRLLPLVEHNGFILSHRFGFRQRHSITEQTHRIVHRINEAFEHKAYSSAAFLDVSQAFDKVWHIGLLNKLRQSLPINYFLLLQSFLQNRHFFIKFASAQHPLSPIHAGVPQDSVLGPVLYLIYNADLPTSPATTIATFADDTAILALNSDPAIASQQLQTHLNAIQTWLHKWRMQANALKSVHVTFTTRTGMCPPVHMKNVQLPCAENVKYLGLRLDRKLTWHHNIFTKRKQLGLTLTKMYWLLGRSSQLSLPNKLLLYKTTLKPIWT